MATETIAPGRAEARPRPGPSPLADRRGPVEALWYSRSVRAQLLIALSLIGIIAVVVAGTVTILRARTATRIEVAASMTLAGLLVQEAVSLVPQDVAPDQALAKLPLQLRFLRHVRILVHDAAGAPIADGSQAAAKADERPGTPAWFAALIEPPIERIDVPVIIKGQRMGSVVVMGAPGDEIAEVWDNTVALGAVAGGLGLAAIGLLWVIFGRLLDPLTGLASGLRDLERRTYEVRLERPRQRELAAITGRFNALAAALEAARAENVQLNHRLITAQDDERRRTARELHDEVGPCLFGLKANAASIGQAAGQMTGAAADTVGERARDIVGIVEHLQAINRSLLNRLRPMALGHVPLKDLIADLVEDRARRHPAIAFAFTAGALADSYGDAIDLTVYRCVQESLTNAIRHAGPAHVAIALGEDPGVAAGALRLTVTDDGSGIAAGRGKGFGLLGMEERVQALGGSFAIDGRAEGGTRVAIVMPASPAAGRKPA